MVMSSNDELSYDHLKEPQRLNVYRIYSKELGACHCHSIVIAESVEKACGKYEHKLGVTVNVEEDVEQIGSFDVGKTFVENVEYCG